MTESNALPVFTKPELSVAGKSHSIVISLNGKSSEEVGKIEGVIMSVNWEALLPAISGFVRLRPDEYIEGLLINETDIRVKISRKKGRKQQK